MPSKWNWSPKNKYGPGGSEEISDRPTTPDPGEDRVFDALRSGVPEKALAELEALRGTGYDSLIDRLQQVIRDDMNGGDFYEWLERQG